MINLCAPAIIYLIFSVTQILIDTFKGLYNTAFIKGIVTVMVTLLLNILCDRGLSAVSWIIVFIPFILLYIFGLDSATGKLNYNGKCNGSTSNCGNGIKIDALGNVIIYDPEYNPSAKPVYYQSPNIIVPNPYANDNVNNTNNNSYYNQIPYGSSSPSYQS
jgi:hypothetical protein